MDKAAAAAGGKTILELEFNRIGSGTFPVYEGPAVLIKNYYTKITHYEPHTRIAYVCDEKDNYRFGFNGMEKDNGAKGIGNSLDEATSATETVIQTTTSVTGSVNDVEEVKEAITG